MSKVLWDYDKVEALYHLPFLDLVYQAQTVHRAAFSANEIELCTLLSVKTGTCPEDCAYCPQSGHYDTGLQQEKLLNIDAVLEAATSAKNNGATRFCMGAAWRNPPAKQFPKILEMVKGVKSLGLETCVTLGMLTDEQAAELKVAGLDFYNHNLDTSPEHYKKIISTRTYEDRINTLKNVRDAGINVCCGGIIGMGEERKDRIEFLLQLSYLEKAPESVPINRLIPITGTPLEKCQELDNFEFIRTIAIARIMFPNSMVRLSAGRAGMSEEMQTLCFMAGANSIWLGERLLTAPNPDKDEDNLLFSKLGLKAKQAAYADS